MTPSNRLTGVGQFSLRLLLIGLLGVTLSGCGTMNYSSGWERSGQLLSQGPDFRRPGQEANYGGDIKTASGTIITNNSMYSYSRVGNTIGIVRSGKSR